MTLKTKFSFSMTITTNIIKPNLFIVGAAKCGTTSLYYYLSQHPEVFDCPVKEPHHFTANYELKFLISGILKNTKPLLAYKQLSNYLALYKNANNHKIVVDASVAYILFDNIANAIQNFNNKAKIIILLRNPIERAFSAYSHNKRAGGTLSFQEDLEIEDKESVLGIFRWTHYKKNGLYYDNVKHYLDTFGQEKVLILFNEDLESNPQKVLSKVCDFLMIDASFVPKIDFTKQNTAHLPKNPKINHLLNKFSQYSMLWNGLKKIFPIQFLRRLKLKINPLMPFQETLTNEKTIQQLKAYYKEDINKLVTLLNRDLSAWK